MKVEVLPAFDFLYEPHPWKCHYSGRGAGKSYSYADALLVAGLMRKCKILCAREYQNSIRDSVHSLLRDRIEALGLVGHYEIGQAYITGRNGTQFLFEGVAHNIDSIRSIPGITHCWIEEAANISERSLDVLIPTVREEGSEIWVTFNPERDDDPIYKKLIINPPPGAVVKKVFYYDNPHLSKKIRAEAEYCKETNPQKYAHIWLGEPIIDYDSLVYRWKPENESPKPLEFYKNHPVYTSWDFGTRDETAVIAWQVIKGDQFPNGCRIHIFDELIAKGQPAQWYRREIDKKPYINHIQGFYCDPSGANTESDLTSWIDKIGYQFTYTHKYSIAEIIDHANDYMPSVRICREQCPRMIRAFRCWAYPVDATGHVKRGMKPIHDDNSHPGSAWYYGIWNHFQRPGSGTKVYRLN